MAVIKHGTVRGYKVHGCRCEDCSKANREAKARERAAKRQRDGENKAAKPPAKPRVPRTENKPTDSDDPSGFVVGALAEALASVTADSPIIKFRKAHALRLASVLDNPKQAYLWSQITKSLLTVLESLIADKPPEDGEEAELRDLMESIRNAPGGGDPPPVHDA